MEKIIKIAVEGKYLNALFVETSPSVFWFFNSKENLVCAKTVSDVLNDPEFWIALIRAGLRSQSEAGEIAKGEAAALLMWTEFIEHKFRGGTDVGFFKNLINTK